MTNPTITLRRPVRTALACALAVTLASCTVEYPVPDDTPTATTLAPTTTDTGSGSGSGSGPADASSPGPSSAPTTGDDPGTDAPTGSATAPAPQTPPFTKVTLPAGFTSASAERAGGWVLTARSAAGCEALTHGTLDRADPGDLREASEALLTSFAVADAGSVTTIDETAFWTGPEIEGGERVPFAMATWNTSAGETVRTAARVFEVPDYWEGLQFDSLAFQLRCPFGAFDEDAWESFTTSIRPRSTGDLTDPWARTETPITP